MFEGTYKAELVVNFHIDDSETGIRAIEDIKADIENGVLIKQLHDLIADELSEDEGLTTVTLNQISAEMEN